MQDYMIERHIPGVGQLTADQLKGAAATSNAALDQLGPGIEWVSSFVTGDKTFCHYRAENEEIIREHARISGFPANVITPIGGTINPATASG
jgi:site-specific DNA-cytosine methylase